MENSTLEQEIADIEQRLAEKKTELGKQAVHETLTEQVQEKMPEYQPAAVQPVQSAPATSSVGSVTPPPTAQAPSYLSDELKDKVQELVNLAFTQSIADAVKAAAKLNNPALIDAFHDVLVDQLYNTLVERGKLKKI